MTNIMNGKICIITGANSGIGKATALGLAEMGATIVMVCRDFNRGDAAMKEIIEKTGNESIDLLIADLSSQKAIHHLVEEFNKKYQKLNVLINNAGLMLRRRTLSEDNIEMNFAVNHLAPFLLTNLLLDVLKKSAPARIINVSSGMHKRAKLDFDDLQCSKKYRGFRAYSKSKLALILFTYELSRRLEDTDVTINALHPGVSKTELMRDLPYLVELIAKAFLKNPKKGAETSIYLASSPEVEGVTGKYFKNKSEDKSSEESYNIDNAQKLWKISEQLTNLKSN